MVTTVVCFQKDIAHITVSMFVSKAGTKLDQVTSALLNDLSDALQCILFNLFNARLHARSLDLHIQCICNAYLEHTEAVCKKGVLRNFENFIGIHLCRSLFLINLLVAF